MKIGIVRETKTPADRRVAITPKIAEQICLDHPQIDFFVQPSTIRAFTDGEYQEAGITISEDLSHCDILIGVKEIDIEALLHDQTYLFFAHVGKKQPYNQALFQRLSELNCSLYDYEYFVDEDGKRVIAFGYWAGVIGAYNAIVGLFKRQKNIQLPLAQSFTHKEDLFSFVSDLHIPSWRFVTTGTGRVGKGAQDLLNEAGIKKVESHELFSTSFSEPVYTVLQDSDYVKRDMDLPYDKEHFHDNPEEYSSCFRPFCFSADALIVGHFWHPKAPPLFTIKEVREKGFSLKLIADITCDIEGAVPCTLRASTLECPFYDYNPDLDCESAPFSSDRHVTMMAVDNLPNALPREASNFFGKLFQEKLLPSLINDWGGRLWESARILNKGELTKQFAYLKDYLGSRLMC